MKNKDNLFYFTVCMLLVMVGIVVSPLPNSDFGEIDLGDIAASIAIVVTAAFHISV